MKIVVIGGTGLIGTKLVKNLRQRGQEVVVAASPSSGINTLGGFVIAIGIPGHGPIGNKSQLIEFRDMLVTVREKVATLKKQGRSRDEVIAAKPTADYDAKWGGFVMNGSFFTKLVYAGV
jgi:nucleoside-diphosphate-sugar epimerase